jgi:DNA (cytosine-5)-methyltransferase 1
MENVFGLVQGKMKLIFADILKQLKESGYKVKARKMNTMYYNVPQSRQRLIFIGVRNDLGVEPSYPKPQTKIITAKEAIQHLEKKEGKITPSMYKKWFETKQGDPIGNYNSIKKLNPHKPCPTITKTSCHYHYKYPRELNVDELKILSSYPLHFKFLDEKSAKERIGNSVPPNFMKAIAEHIKNNIMVD